MHFVTTPHFYSTTKQDVPSSNGLADEKEKPGVSTSSSTAIADPLSKPRSEWTTAIAKYRQAKQQQKDSSEPPEETNRPKPQTKKPSKRSASKLEVSKKTGDTTETDGDTTETDSDQEDSSPHKAKRTMKKKLKPTSSSTAATTDSAVAPKGSEKAKVQGTPTRYYNPPNLSDHNARPNPKNNVAITEPTPEVGCDGKGCEMTRCTCKDTMPFKNTCQKCGRGILNQSVSKRIALINGGWSGWFCSWYCAQTYNKEYEPIGWRHSALRMKAIEAHESSR